MSSEPKKEFRKIHKHQYTIPVEKITELTNKIGEDGMIGTMRHLEVVTKLRCVCGEEIER